jgi:hypothetical protein
VRSFVKHYDSIGVKHLVFLDNGSTDGAVEALQESLRAVAEKNYPNRHEKYVTALEQNPDLQIKQETARELYEARS